MKKKKLTKGRLFWRCGKDLRSILLSAPAIALAGGVLGGLLYHLGLRKILAPERNIIRVQKMFYCYPTEEGDRMIRLEVLGNEKADHRKLTPRNSLERGMFRVWDEGGRFHTTGMFLLNEELRNA